MYVAHYIVEGVWSMVMLLWQSVEYILLLTMSLDARRKGVIHYRDCRKSTGTKLCTYQRVHVPLLYSATFYCPFIPSMPAQLFIQPMFSRPKLKLEPT